MTTLQQAKELAKKYNYKTLQKPIDAAWILTYYLPYKVVEYMDFHNVSKTEAVKTILKKNLAFNPFKINMPKVGRDKSKINYNRCYKHCNLQK